MGLIWDILKIASKVKERAIIRKDIRGIFLEELNKEIAQQQNYNKYEHDTLSTSPILSDYEEIDNGNIYDIEAGETLRDL